MENLMLLVAALMTLVMWVRHRNLMLDNQSAWVLSSVLLESLLLTLNPFLNHHTGVEGIVGRLGMISYVQAAIAIPLLLSLLLRTAKFMVAAAAAIFAVLLALSFMAPPPLSLQQHYVREREMLVSELPEFRGELCARPFVIARHGDEFLITALSGIPSQQSRPTEAQECVYWLIYEPAGISSAGENGAFVLVKDEDLASRLRSLSPQQYRRLLAANSHLRDLAGVGVTLK
jgi:hypothetical protein